MRLVYIINANINFKMLSVYILYKQYILNFIFCQYNTEISFKKLVKKSNIFDTKPII